MIIDITSFFFNSSIVGATATPAWGTSIGQSKSKDCRIESTKQGVTDVLTGMIYKSKTDRENFDLSKGSQSREYLIYSIFDKVYVNDKRIEGMSFILLLSRENSKSHQGRLNVSYPPYASYSNGDLNVSNEGTIDAMREVLGCGKNGCWFGYKISVVNQDELHFYCVVVNNEHPMSYSGTSAQRSSEWSNLIPESIDAHVVQNNFHILQQIYYGAPGTGKSFNINKLIDKDHCERITFHPDTDYSNFVGCYKPIAKKSDGDRILSKEELAAKIRDLKDLGENYPPHKISTRYWKSFNALPSRELKPLLESAGFGESFLTELSKGRGVGEYLAQQGVISDKTEITYSFVPQAFITAYINAWKDLSTPYYLVIEEINRGNCAQIFGDIFQLLDRGEDGFSSYGIRPITDLQQYLEEEFQGSSITDEKIKRGIEMRLPSNLYILATMNTSDQSLFPIDSAFKRRWDWKYMKIKDAGKGWKVDFQQDNTLEGERIDWWSFIQKINIIISDMTSSADKQLGYFFCKPDKKIDDTASESTIISKEKFVGKVLFYLWNDVFKEYGFDNADLFTFVDNGTERELTFPDFYNDDNEVNSTVVKAFITNVLNWNKDGRKA